MSGAAPQRDFVAGSPQLAYAHAGSGEVVVFLHGIGGNRNNWLRQLAALEDGYHAVAWDARGYGDSEDYPAALKFTDFADDLERLLDHLKVARAHVCGLSMGGRIALDFYDRHPQRVRSLILADTFPGFDSSFTPAGRERFINERRQPLLDGKTVRDIALSLAPGLVSTSASKEIVQELVDSMSALRAESYIKAVEALTRYEPVTAVSSIAVPVQIIVGADDKLTPAAISKTMHEGIRQSRLLIIENAGHLSNIEQPAAFNACLREFLDTLQT